MFGTKILIMFSVKVFILYVISFSHKSFISEFYFRFLNIISIVSFFYILYI